MRLPALLVAVSTLLSVPPVVFADPGQRILLWPEHPGVEANAAADGIADAGHQALPWQPLWKNLARGRDAARQQTEAAIDDVVPALGNLEEDYLAQRYDSMHTRAREALEESGAFLAERDPDRLLWPLVLQLGISALYSEKEAAPWFRLCLILDPKRRPDPLKYGSDIRSAFANEVVARDKMALSSVSFSLTPADATVFINGTRVMHPTRGVRLLPGPHLLRVDAPGYQTDHLVIDTTGQEVVEFALAPANGQEASLGGPWSRGLFQTLSPSAIRALRQTQAKRGADALVILGKRDARYHAQLMVDGAVAKPVSAATARDAVEQALAFLGPNGEILESKSVAVADATAGRSVFRKWWFWTGVGAVVVGGVVTAVLLSQEDGRDSLDVSVLPP